jgi:uncharacterized membrane protein YbaN (DUF454 family)
VHGKTNPAIGIRKRQVADGEPERIAGTLVVLPTERKGVRRVIFLVLGLFFVALGGLGAALPVLPTTPFLLLASACFVRSSPVLHRWLLRSRLFGPLLRDWQQRRGIRLHVKLTAVTVLFTVVAASVVWGNLPWYLLVALIGLALVGLIVVLRLPVITDEHGKNV